MRRHKEKYNKKKPILYFLQEWLQKLLFFIEGSKELLHPKKQNLRLLIKYSRLFKIEDEIRKYMEVLL